MIKYYFTEEEVKDIYSGKKVLDYATVVTNMSIQPLIDFDVKVAGFKFYNSEVPTTTGDSNAPWCEDGKCYRHHNQGTNGKQDWVIIECPGCECDCGGTNDIGGGNSGPRFLVNILQQYLVIMPYAGTGPGRSGGFVQGSSPFNPRHPATNPTNPTNPQQPGFSDGFDNPVIGALLQIKPSPEDNLKKLKKMMEDPKIKSSYNTLRSNVGQGYEMGFSFSDDNDPVPLENDSKNPKLVRVKLGGLIWGASHTHPNPDEKWIPMFSLSDIRSLVLIAARYNNNGRPKDYSKFVFTLTVKNGDGSETFALKISDFNKLSSFFNNAQVQFKKLGDKLQANYEELDSQAGLDGYLAVLFKFMNKYGLEGVEIYKAYNSLTNWTKL